MKKNACLGLILLLLAAASTTPLFAHAELKRSDPAAGSTLDHSPTDVFLWFSQPLSTGSKISVFDTQFQAVDKGTTFIDASDATLMRVQLNPLVPGRYTVNWKTIAVDGHPTSGSYDFIVQESINLAMILVPVVVGVVILIVVLVLVARRRGAA
jgi:methionine-rich copper-binding protein CopC